MSMNYMRAVLLLPTVLLGAVAGLAQTPPSEAPAVMRPVPASEPGAETSAQPAAKSEHQRAISPELAASLARTMPAYNPPKPPEPKAAEELDAEQPRNQIIRLPRVVVEGNRPPVFTERQQYTKEGLEALAVARYLSEFDRGVLNRYTLPLFGQSAEQRAMTEYEEAERQRHIAEAQQSIYILKDHDPVAAEQLKKESESAYIRRIEFLPTPGSNRK